MGGVVKAVCKCKAAGEVLNAAAVVLQVQHSQLAATCRLGGEGCLVAGLLSSGRRLSAVKTPNRLEHRCLAASAQRARTRSDGPRGREGERARGRALPAARGATPPPPAACRGPQTGPGPADQRGQHSRGGAACWDHGQPGAGSGGDRGQHRAATGVGAFPGRARAATGRLSKASQVGPKARDQTRASMHTTCCCRCTWLRASEAHRLPCCWAWAVQPGRAWRAAPQQAPPPCKTPAPTHPPTHLLQEALAERLALLARGVVAGSQERVAGGVPEHGVCGVQAKQSSGRRALITRVQPACTRPACTARAAAGRRPWPRPEVRSGDHFSPPQGATSGPRDFAQATQ